MKQSFGLKVCLSLGLLATALQSFAELKSVDDEVLSGVTGREGLTIDIDMGIEIGEFMYKDAGSIVMGGMRLGGMDHSAEVGTKFNAQDGIVADPDDPGGAGCGTFAGNSAYGCTTGLNNVRVLVDVAGDGSTQGRLLIDGGVIDIPPIGPGPEDIVIPTSYINDNQFYFAWGNETSLGSSGSTGCGDNGKCLIQLNDGDLFIHGEASDTGLRARPFELADFGMELDYFKLKDSGYIAGDDISNKNGTAGVSQETTIMSNLRIEGYFGGFDMLLENKGNGFGEYDELGTYTETGIGDAASRIKLQTFFEITEMEYDFDIVGIRYESIRVHNKRGHDLMFDYMTQENYGDEAAQLGGFVNSISTTQGFAQSNTQIWAVKDNVIKLDSDNNVNGSNNREDYVDGIVLDSRFRGDMDIGHLSFGDTGSSIGEQYWTDMDINTVMTISAN
ncbi:MAG: hypothetical protein C9356_15530 [Oleiphilus sp.]|nr:MAG: hypothetical protein C9356_15530 [Oleiphilus sp.]